MAQEEREGSWDGAMLKLLLANVWSGEGEVDKMGLRLAKQQEIRNTSYRDLLHHSILDQAVALDGRTGRKTWAGLGEVGICIYISDGWCSNTVSTD